MLRLAYSVTLWTSSHFVVDAISNPTLNFDKSAFNAKEDVVFWFAKPPDRPRLSSPKLRLSEKFPKFRFSPADESKVLSVLPIAYTEMGFEESPEPLILVVYLVPIS